MFLVVLGVGSVAGGLDSVASAAPGEDFTPIGQSACGAPGQPPCPLQSWMRSNVAAPLAANKTEVLAAGLAQAAKLSPDPAWSSWATIAQSGAAAAKRGDIAGARASCKSCHEAWREAYKTKFRLRPVPR